MTVPDVEVAICASGLLLTFNEAGVLDLSDVHVANRICSLGKELDERVALAVALLVRGLRGGSVCVDLATIASTVGRGPGRQLSSPRRMAATWAGVLPQQPPTIRAPQSTARPA